MKPVNGATFRFGDFELDPSRRSLTRNGELLSLNSKTFDLLCQLVENHGTVVTKDELLSRVWPDQFVEENNLTVQISALRKALGGNLISTIPGKGYSFVAEVEQSHSEDEIIVENLTVERIVVEQTGEQASPLMLEGKRRPRFAAVAAIAVLIIAVAVGGWYYLAKIKGSAVNIDSIAVMPFVYEGGNADAEYLSDGMTESMINSLSRLPNLTVKASNSVFKYKGKEFDSNKVAGEMSVQALLLGRITERGDSITLSLELIDAKTNNHLWGETYQRKTIELAGMQNEIARDVSDKLRSKLAGNSTLAKGQTTNSQAMALYQKGRFFWNKRRHNDHLKAIEAFEQALKLDPKFALAYAGLGDVYTVDSFRTENKAATHELGRQNAMKALEIEPELAEGYAILAKVSWNHRDPVEAQKHFLRAIELNPNYAEAHHWYGEFLAQHGRHAAARAEMNRAMELDPLSMIFMSDSAFIYSAAGDHEAAIVQARKALEIDSSWNMAYSALAGTHEARGDYEKALDILTERAEVKPGVNTQEAKNEIAYVRKLLKSDGAKGYWKANFEIERRKPEPEQERFFLAVCHAQLGNLQAAIDELEKSVANDESGYATMKVEPLLDPLKNEPRFQALLSRIGLLTDF